MPVGGQAPTSERSYIDRQVRLAEDFVSEYSAPFVSASWSAAEQEAVVERSEADQRAAALPEPVAAAAEAPELEDVGKPAEAAVPAEPVAAATVEPEPVAEPVVAAEQQAAEPEEAAGSAAEAVSKTRRLGHLPGCDRAC